MEQRRRLTVTFRLYREINIFGRTKIKHIADVSSIVLAKMFANCYVSNVKNTAYKGVIPLVDRLIILQSTNGAQKKVIYFDFVRHALEWTEKTLEVDEEQPAETPKSNCWNCMFCAVVLIEVVLISVCFFDIAPIFA